MYTNRPAHIALQCAERTGNSAIHVLRIETSTSLRGSTVVFILISRLRRIGIVQTVFDSASVDERIRYASGLRHQ